MMWAPFRAVLAVIAVCALVYSSAYIIRAASPAVEDARPLGPAPRNAAKLETLRRDFETSLKSGNRRAKISVSRDRVAIDLELAFPPDSTAYAALAKGNAPEYLMAAAFGQLFDGAQPLELTSATSTWSVVDGKLSIVARVEAVFDERATHLELRPSSPELVPAEDVVVVSLEGRTLRYASPRPENAGARELTIRGAPDADDSATRRRPIGPVALDVSLEPRSVAPEPSIKPSARGTLRWLDRVVTGLPVVRDLGNALRNSLPLLILLVRLSSPTAGNLFDDRARRLLNALALLGFLPWLLSLLTFLSDDLPALFERGTLGAAGQLGAWAVAPAVLGGVAPGWLAGPIESDARPPSQWFYRIVAGVVAVSLIVAGIVANKVGELPTWLRLLPVEATAVVSAFALFAAFGEGPRSRAEQLLVCLGGAWLLVAASVVSAYWSYGRPILPTALEPVIIAVNTLSGVALVWATLGVAHRLIVRRDPALRFPYWSALMAALIASVPIAGNDAPHPGFWTHWHAGDLGTILGSFIPWIVACSVVAGLIGKAPSSFAIEEVPRSLGILALSAVILGTDIGWCFIPFRFLIGWGLLRQVVRNPREVDAKSFPMSEQERGAMVEAAFSSNAIIAAFDARRTRASASLAEGEDPIANYASMRGRRRRALDKTLALHAEKARLALSFGPRDSAAANGLYGAWWAVILASPWIVLAAKEVLATEILSSYGLCWTAYRFMAIVGKWAAIGFLFGFFFPYIHGRGGLQKALFVFVALAVSVAPSAMLVSELSALLYWCVQLLVVLLLLGLVAFDYASLRRLGVRGVRLLFDVHGMPTLGVSVSSILVGLGVTITEALNGHLTQLVNAALQFAVPAASEVLGAN
jgi:hypothetical protein